MRGSLAGTLLAVTGDDADAGDRVLRFVTLHGWAPLRSAAQRHGITGCLWSAVRAAGLDDVADSHPIRAAHFADLGRHLRTLSDLAAIDNDLRCAGVDFCAVKGPVLAEVVYPRPDLRSYVDLDLVVAPAGLSGALSALERSGWELLDQNWPLMHSLRIGQVRLRARSGTVLDLHWHLLSKQSRRADFGLGRSTWAPHLRWVQVGTAKVRTLDPVMTLIHLGVHAALTGGHRLVWVKDIDAAVRNEAPGWDEVCRRAALAKAGPPVALMLGRARSLLGTPVPDDVLRELVPEPRWRTLTALTDRLAPVSRGRGGASAGRLVARSARSDGRASVRELRRRTLSVVRPATGGSRRSSAWLFDPTDGRSLTFPAGDAAARRAYLDLVAEQDG